MHYQFSVMASANEKIIVNNRLVCGKTRNSSEQDITMAVHG